MGEGSYRGMIADPPANRKAEAGGLLCRRVAKKNPFCGQDGFAYELLVGPCPQSPAVRGV